VLGRSQSRDRTAVEGLADASAAILAGGQGRRLRAVTGCMPKVLAEVRGRPFLKYLLEQLAAAGVKHVVLCTGYLGEQVQDTFGDLYCGLRLDYSQELSPLGTAGALRLALPLFRSHSVLAMNGDSFCEADLVAFWARHCEWDADATLLMTQAPDTRRYGHVRVDGDGHVLGFDEKNENGHPGWINAGVYAVKRDLLELVPPNAPVSLERQMIPGWIARRLYGYQSAGRFLDIGTPEAYREAQAFFAQGAAT